MPLEAQNLAEKPATGAAAETQSQQNAGKSKTPGEGGGQGGESSQKPTKPEWLSDNHWDPDAGTIKEDFGAHYNELATFRQAETDRLAKIPQAPEGYEFAIPEDIQLPAGVTREQLAVAKDDPEFKSLQKTLFEAKVDPEVGQKIYGLYVKKQVEEVQKINARVGEEQKKLGPNYAERVGALGNFFEARIGKELAADVLKGIFTANQVMGMEKLVALFANQGAAPMSAKGAEKGEEPGKIPGWDKMNFAEKRAAQAKAAQG